MSYNVMICKKPVPQRNEEAWDFIRLLEERSEDDKRKLPDDVMKLYYSLTEKYPCICELPEDEIDDGLWCDGPLINDFSHDYICIGMVFSKVNEGLPFIIKEAKRLGFVVFDPQDEKIHRPFF